MQRPLDIKDKEIQDKWCFSGFEVIQGMRRTPDVLYGIFTEVLKRIYSDEDAFVLGERKVRWCPDESNTQIWIGNEGEWEDQAPGFRPAVYVKLSAINYTSFASRSGKIGIIDKTGGISMARQAACQVQISHRARTSGEAVSIANTSHGYIDAFGIPIRDDFLFEVFVLKQRTIVKPVRNGETTEYESDIICDVQWQENFFIAKEALKFKRTSSIINGN